MPRYKFSAQTHDGKRVSGFEVADSHEQVVLELQARGLAVIGKPTEATDGGIFSGKKRYTQEKVRDFLYELAFLYSKGVGLTAALDVLAKTYSFAGDIYDKIRQGASIGEAMRSTKAFDDTTIYAIKMGDTSGRLVESLNMLAERMTQAIELKKDIQGMMVYPIVFGCIFILVLGIVFYGLAPKLQEVVITIERTKGPADLPFITQLLFGISDVLRNSPVGAYGSILLLVLVLVGLTKAGVTKKLAMNIPLVHRYYYEIMVIEAFGLLTIMLKSGIKVNTILGMMESSSNDMLKDVFGKIKEKVDRGSSVSSAFESSELSYDIKKLIIIGEETGSLEEMTTIITERYRKSLKKMIESIKTWVNIGSTLVLAACVIIFALFFYVPLFKITRQMMN